MHNRLFPLLFCFLLLSASFSPPLSLLSPGMQDFENAVAAPTSGGAAGGKAALNAAAATAAPTPRRRALGELKTNANAALTPAAAAAHLGAHPQQQQKVKIHAPIQRPPTGKPPAASLSQQQKKKATGVTIPTANAAVAAPSPSLLRLPPVERSAGMPLDQQLAAEELRAQGMAHAAAQAICAGVPLSMQFSASRYSSSQKNRRHLGPAAAAAAAARTFTVFGDDDDEFGDAEQCCRPSSAPPTPPAESSFLGEEEEQGKERER